MSVNGILGAGLSGLAAAQQGLRTASNNISNVNTVGYQRQVVDQSARVTAGRTDGVAVDAVRRVTDRFLEAAAWRSGAQRTAATARSDLLDRAQGSFGDPVSGGSLNGRLNSLLDAAAAAQADPSQPLRRSALVQAASDFFANAQGVAADVAGLRGEADRRIGDLVVRADGWMQEIARLNVEISRARAQGGDATGAEGAQAQLITQLSEIMDIKTQARPGGGVMLRTGDGVLLVGETAGRLSYTATGDGAPGAIHGRIQLLFPAQAAIDLDPHIKGGEIRGLIDARDTDLPAISEEIAALTATVASALDAASAAATPVPAPTSLTGRQTGLLLGDAANFSGGVVLARLDANGVVLAKATIDLSTAATVQDIRDAINASGIGITASFSNGVFSLTGGTDGVAIQQDPLAPSQRAGRGFADVFGLGAMTRANAPSDTRSGVSGTDAAGFAGGGQVSLRLVLPDGTVRASPVATLTGGTINTAITDFNAALAPFAAATLGPDGRLSITPLPGQPPMKLEVVGDTSAGGARGLSFTQMFGVGPGQTAGRTTAIGIDPAILANPRRLGQALPDLAGTPVGGRALETGDGRGLAGLAALRTAQVDFAGGGSLTAGRSTLADLAARVSAQTGVRASQAESAAQSAIAVGEEVDARKAGVTGVNLDEEIVKLTTYQQSYAASSRVIQAGRDMMDTLLSILR
jgi:flagellar hook-associated protein 1